MKLGWVGVDLDGTLATGTPGIGTRIGHPIPAMIRRIQEHIAEGREVRVVTARMDPNRGAEAVEELRVAIREWTWKHVGLPLEATNAKDMEMHLLYDDRARQVEYNTGRIIGEE